MSWAGKPRGLRPGGPHMIHQTPGRLIASRSRLCQHALGLAEVAVRAGGHKVVLAGSAARCDGHDMVELQDHSRLACGAAAVAAPEAVALEDGEPEPRRDRLACSGPVLATQRRLKVRSGAAGRLSRALGPQARRTVAPAAGPDRCPGGSGPGLIGLDG